MKALLGDLETLAAEDAVAGGLRRPGRGARVQGRDPGRESAAREDDPVQPRRSGAGVLRRSTRWPTRPRPRCEAHGPALLQYGPSLGLRSAPRMAGRLAGGRPSDQVLGERVAPAPRVPLPHPACEPGDVVVTESPTYDRTLTLLRRHGAGSWASPSRHDGPDLDRLEACSPRRAPRFVYLIPDFQNPSGATCSGAEAAPHRRPRGAATTSLIVEDAPYRPLRYRGIEEPLALLARPGAHPPHELVQQAHRAGPARRLHGRGGRRSSAASRRLAEDTYICPDNLAHGIAYEWCRRGHLPARSSG